MELPAVLPRRHRDIEVAEFETELVVFNSRANQLHLVQSAPALVLDACDGVTSTSSLVADLVDAGAGTLTEAEDLVAGALAALSYAGLLDGTTPAVPSPCVGCTDAPQRRRRFSRR